jgi:hypothetical protein
MKFINICILFICLLGATFSNGFIIVLFKINQPYIAKELCVMRDIPHNKCQGQCFLRKELNKAAKSNGANSASGKDRFEIQLFFVDALPDISCPGISSQDLRSGHQHFTQQLVIRGFFHPPAA